MSAFQSGGSDSFVKQRCRHLLKICLAALAAAGLCGWGVYRWFNPPSEYANDFTVKSAIAWLENADAGKFDVCRKNIEDGDWFAWFEKDRLSLEKTGGRELFQRREIAGASAGMKRYELKFDTRFRMFKNPRNQVTERVLIESDGRQKYRVLLADYWLRRAFDNPLRRTPSKEEMNSIRALSGKVLEAIEGGNADFFKEAALVQMKGADYFGWKKYRLAELRNGKRITALNNLFRNQQTSPRKFSGAGITSFRGRTGFEEASVRYRFTVDKGKRERNYVLVIGLSRDFYLDKSAPWRYEYIYSTEVKKEK